MRHLLVVVALGLGLSACAAAPGETASPLPPASDPLRFRPGAPLVLVADELAPAAAVDTALFVQVELRSLATTDAAVASIGVELSTVGGHDGVVLDPTQVDAILTDLQEVQLRRQGSPVITLRDQQRVSFGASDEAALDLLPQVLEGRREVRVEVRRADDSLRITVPTGAGLLLRHGEPGAPRWTLVFLGVISLRDEDARRYTVDGD